MHMFAETAPGSDRIVHTAMTAYIAKVPVARSYISHVFEDVRPATAVGAEALHKVLCIPIMKYRGLTFDVDSISRVKQKLPRRFTRPLGACPSKTANRAHWITGVT